MFGKRIELFKLFGFAVRVDASWLVIALLLTWSLATGLFPSQFPADEAQELTPTTYWTMGVVSMVSFFLSIVLHELGHSLMARAVGVRMEGITLFIFGGVAEMKDEPPSPHAEFLVAIGGPIVSVVIAATCYGLYLVGTHASWPVSVNGVLWYLGLINAVLLAFNLIPAFPLDGGRVLRSILWSWKGRLKWATQITSQIGASFGLFMMLAGVMNIVGGNFIGGMWWAVLGMFLRGAAQSSYQQLLVRQSLEGEVVSHFMNADVKTVPADISLRELVDDYFYKFHFKMLPVMDKGHLIGCVTTAQVSHVPREEWNDRSVGDIAEVSSAANTISPDSDAIKALKQMSEHNSSRLMVVAGGQLQGIISLKDLLRFISLKMDLEE